MRFYAKLPSQVVALSLVACLVVVGAPALVSIIDDSVNQNYDILQAPDYRDPLAIYPNNVRIQGEVVSPSDLGVEIIRDDNMITILSDTPGYSGILSISLLDKSIITSASKIVIKSSTEYSGIFLEAGDHDVFGIYDPDMHQYEFALSSIDRHYIMSTDSDYLFVNLINTSASGKTFSAVETVSIEIYGSIMIPYAEIIIGLSGIVLMLCALFATPWFGFKGYTGKKFWRR